jgi:signal transduction histidine kinase
MSEAPMNVLVVEDNPGDARLLHEIFNDAVTNNAIVTHVATMGEAEKYVAENTTDLIVLDLGLPDVQGLAAVQRARAAAPHVPLVVLTCMDNEALAVQALQEGAHDYLVKGQVEPRGLLRALHLAVERESHQREMTLQRRELERSNADLEQFAYAASHDLQEPLRMMISYTQLLAKRYKGKLDSDADDFIAFAVDGANRMQRLIRDLLAYSHVGSQGVALVGVSSEHALAQALANLYKVIAERSAEVTHDPLPWVMADETQLIQLFQNLIGNAIKYQNGGTPQVHVSAAKIDDSGWLFSVKDNGLGIEPRYFEKIFGMFQRLHGRNEYAGTGIGLAICKKIVERHGGTISVESEPGHGSTFSFTLAEYIDEEPKAME